MRHRAPRPLTRLLYRLPRATARLIAGSADRRAGPALVALLVVLSVGTAAYAALTSVNGSSQPQAQGAGSSVAPDDALQSESRDAERPTPVHAPPGSRVPTPHVRSSAPSALPTTRPPAVRRATPSRSASPSAPAPASASSTPEDDTAPDTSLSAEYPSGDAATFSFGADEPASFTCSLDGAPYASCDSPVSYTGLASGWHTFAVRATDGAGNVDPSPAGTSWHAEGSSTGE